MTVEQIVESYRSRIVDAAIFFRPNIPRRKTLGAISAYAHGVPEDDILVLVDNTVFGGAGDGLIITPTIFAAHDIAEPAVRVPISEVQEVWLDPGGFAGSKIYVSGNRLLVTLHHPGGSGIAQLVEMMRAIVSGPATRTDPAKAIQARGDATHCRSCGAPLPTAAPSCIYCGTASS